MNDICPLPYALALLLVALTCMVTRFCGNRYVHVSGPKNVVVLPYWIPWLGHTVSFSRDCLTFLTQCQKHTNDGVFGVMIRGSKHNVIVSPSIAQNLNDLLPNTSTRNRNVLLLRTFFNDGGKNARVEQTAWNKFHQQQGKIQKDPWLSDLVGKIIKGLERRAFNLVTFNESWVDQSSWERASNVVVSGSGSTAEVSLFPLIQNFIGDLSCTVLMGRNFLENNPEILQDLWTWDSKFMSFVMRMPAWLPVMSAPAAARSRVLHAMVEYREALSKFIRGEDLGTDWTDMMDVSQIMIDSANTWCKAGAFRHASVSGDAMLLWALNKSSNAIVFWLLYRVYSHPELLVELREEVKNFIWIAQRKAELPISEPPAVSIDLDGLMKRCPLLRSTMYETLRLDTQSLSYTAATEDLVVKGSFEDAIKQRKVKAECFRLLKGEPIYIAYNVHHRDPRFWTDPETFHPRRFLLDEESYSANGSASIATAFGGGPTGCPGRWFAEREIMAFSAVILAMWDITPVGGEWEWPGQKLGSGTMIPTRVVRVRMGRRSTLAV